MGTGYFILIGVGLGVIGFLLWMLYPVDEAPKKKRKTGGICPICKQALFKGERIRSSVVEIGDYEVQTKIKGCPYCLGEIESRKRLCPVCKKKLPLDQHLLALSDPKVDAKRLSIKGCAQCFPQGF